MSNFMLGLAGLGCIGVGAYLCQNHSNYWGWFLFAGVILLGNMSNPVKDNK